MAAGQPDREMAYHVKEVFWRHARRYGSRRIKEELVAEGLAVGRARVRTVMREEGLRAIQPRSFVPRTTDSRHGQRISPNLLLERKPVSRPNEVIVGDITYLPLQTGRWGYSASWQDKFTKRVVRWAVEERMTEELVIKALAKAVVQGGVECGTIIHTDL